MNTHITTIHIRCPFHPVWDYYTVTVETDEFLQCERLQDICDEIRGKEITQEDVFEYLRHRIGQLSTITVEGMHGANGKLVISGPTEPVPDNKT